MNFPNINMLAWQMCPWTTAMFIVHVYIMIMSGVFLFVNGPRTVSYRCCAPLVSSSSDAVRQQCWGWRGFGQRSGGSGDISGEADGTLRVIFKIAYPAFNDQIMIIYQLRLLFKLAIKESINQLSLVKHSIKEWYNTFINYQLLNYSFVILLHVMINIRQKIFLLSQSGC